MSKNLPKSLKTWVWDNHFIKYSQKTIKINPKNQKIKREKKLKKIRKRKNKIT